jgi:hypothetical protein
MAINENILRHSEDLKKNFPHKDNLEFMTSTGWYNAETKIWT